MLSYVDEAKIWLAFLESLPNPPKKKKITELSPETLFIIHCRIAPLYPFKYTFTFVYILPDA